jgi:flagellar basal-body rod protein FlgF
MLRGLYAAASGMVAQIARQEIYANNLANANSVGFRRGRSALGQFQADLAAALDTAGSATGGATAKGATCDLSQGPLTATGRTLDLALNGDAFFTVQTSNGPVYTRDGRFMLDAQKRLVTSTGDPVLGENGPITLSSGIFSVANDGTITCAGQTAGRLRLLTPVNPQALGRGLYTAAQTTTPVSSSVQQGMIEQSNVSGIQEMGLMMNGYRLYEANATALRYQDETLNSLMKVAQ